MNSGGEYAGRCNSDGQSIIVQITDSCPQCELGHFDIQALTYSKVLHPAVQLCHLFAATGAYTLLLSCSRCSLPGSILNTGMILSKTWVQISPEASGRINIQYRRVQCVPPSSLAVVVDNNNGPQGWLRMFVTVRTVPLLSCIPCVYIMLSCHAAQACMLVSVCTS